MATDDDPNVALLLGPADHAFVWEDCAAQDPGGEGGDCLDKAKAFSRLLYSIKLMHSLPMPNYGNLLEFFQVLMSKEEIDDLESSVLRSMTKSILGDDGPEHLSFVDIIMLLFFPPSRDAAVVLEHGELGPLFKFAHNPDITNSSDLGCYFIGDPRSSESYGHKWHNYLNGGDGDFPCAGNLSLIHI